MVQHCVTLALLPVDMVHDCPACVDSVSAVSSLQIDEIVSVKLHGSALAPVSSEQVEVDVLTAPAVASLCIVVPFVGLGVTDWGEDGPCVSEAFVVIIVPLFSAAVEL